MQLSLLPSHLVLRLQLLLIITCWLITNKLGAGDNAHSVLHDLKIKTLSNSIVAWWALIHSLILRANIYQMPSPHQGWCYVLEGKCFLLLRTSLASAGDQKEERAHHASRGEVCSDGGMNSVHGSTAGGERGGLINSAWARRWFSGTPSCKATLTLAQCRETSAKEGRGGWLFGVIPGQWKPIGSLLFFCFKTSCPQSRKKNTQGNSWQSTSPSWSPGPGPPR